MERVSRLLESGGATTTNGVVEGVRGKRSAFGTALNVLVDEGYVQRRAGPRNSHMHASIRPFRKADDDDEGTSQRPEPP